MPSPEPLGPVAQVSPKLRVTLPGGPSPAVLEQIRSAPGVAAAARLGVANVEGNISGSPSEVSLAAVEPLEFRALAPQGAAEAEFVWQVLLRGQVVLTHEERARLGADLGIRMPVQGPGGQTSIRVGGLAANGLPNLAGGMVSLAVATSLGFADPEQVLVGVADGAQPEEVGRALREIPGALVEPMGGLTDRPFLTGREAARQFGSFRYASHKDGSITPDPAWVRKNIVTRRVPILGEVRCHRLMVPQLEGAMRELQQAGLSSLVDVGDYHYQGGCYVPRHIDRNPQRALSLHSWGLAVDVNVATNPAGERPKQDPRLVAIFERWGFRWGGRWSPPDGHHFELAALMRL